MAASGRKSVTVDRSSPGVAAVLGAVVVAIAAGAAVPWGALVAALAVVGVCAVVRFGPTTVLLHTLVLSMFVEGVPVGSFRAGRILAIVVPVFLLVIILVSRWRPPRIPAPVWLPGLLFGAWAWASGLWAADGDAWLATMGALGLAAAYFLAFAFLVESPTQVRQLLRTYVLGAVVMAFVSLAQTGVNVRAVGLQGDPNIFSLYQIAAIPAACMLARTTRSGWARAGWLLLILPLLASVFAAQSRGGLVTIAVLLPLCLARGDLGRFRGRVVLAVAGLAGVVGLIAAVGEKVDERLSLSAILADKGTGRLDIWYAAFHGGYLQHPLLGLGAGGFEPVSSQLLETTPGVEIDPGSSYLRTGIRVHSLYIEALTELGPIGLLTWVAVLVGAAIVLIRVAGIAARAVPESALLPMLVAFAVATTFLSVANNKLLWMVVGLAAASVSTHYLRPGQRADDRSSPSVGGADVPRSGWPARIGVSTQGSSARSTT